MMLLAKHGGGVGIGINQIRPASAIKLKEMEQVTELCLFVRYTIQQYLPLIKDLSDEELHQLTSILITPTLKNGLKLESLKETLIVNRSTSTSVLWSATSLCEELKAEMLKQEKNGESYYKSVKQLENLIYYLRAIQTRITQQQYKKHGLKVHMTNICSEITLHTDESHTFVCCLSSLNLAKYDEWKNTNLIYDSYMVLRWRVRRVYTKIQR